MGLAGDHISSIQSLVRDYVSSNWLLTGDLVSTKVLFGTGWYDNQRQFQIHFRHDVSKPNKIVTIGSKPINQFDDLVLAHCFAEEQTDNAEPANLDVMNRELQRIIGSDATGLEFQGVCSLTIDSTPRTMPLEQIDSQSTIYHSVIGIRLVYRKGFS